MRQSATMLIRKFFHSLALVVFCGLVSTFGAGAQNAPPPRVDLTIPQARQVAVQAIRNNQPKLALQIASGLLQRDRNDSFAHFVIARASQQLGKPKEGRRAAARAYRLATSKVDKFTSSQLAARLSYDQKRLTLAQVWLRRSVNHVQSPQQREQIAKDYKRLRSENPWNTQLQFSLAPSSNVNGGSDSALAIVEGVPYTFGTRAAANQALSGQVGVADLNTSYRFSGSAKQAAYLTGRFYTRQVHLSSQAERKAPGARNHDYSATTVELGLRYVFADAKGTGFSTIRATAGKNWYAGKPKSTHARLEYEYSFSTNKHTRLTFTGSHERRNYDSNQVSLQTNGLRANIRYKFDRGDAIGLGLIARKTSGDDVNSKSSSATAYVSYEMAKPVGPATIAFSFGAAYYDFPDYEFGLIVVPGGRQDTTTFATFVMAFEELEYAGFTPTITLRAQRNQSNISILNSTALSASIGIKSSF